MCLDPATTSTGSDSWPEVLLLELGALGRQLPCQAPKQSRRLAVQKTAKEKGAPKNLQKVFKHTQDTTVCASSDGYDAPKSPGVQPPVQLHEMRRVSHRKDTKGWSLSKLCKIMLLQKKNYTTPTTSFSVWQGRVHFLSVYG